jgi:hypothetical protein
MEYEIEDKVWYKGKKCIIADRLKQSHGGYLYALSDENGKDVKGEIDDWWVSENRLSVRLKSD